MGNDKTQEIRRVRQFYSGHVISKWCSGSQDCDGILRKLFRAVLRLQQWFQFLWRMTWYNTIAAKVIVHLECVECNSGDNTSWWHSGASSISVFFFFSSHDMALVMGTTYLMLWVWSRHEPCNGHDVGHVTGQLQSNPRHWQCNGQDTGHVVATTLTM